MNFARAIFELARGLNRGHTTGYPNPLGGLFAGLPVPVGPRLDPTFLLLGVEAQFHRWRFAIRREILRSCFGYTDNTAVRRQARGLDDVLAKVFREDEHGPALIWTSPIWFRTENVVRRAGLERENKPRPVIPYDTGSSGSADVPVHMGGDAIVVRVGRGALFRHHAPFRSYRFLVHPWLRRITTPNGRIVSGAVDESLIVGDAAEEGELRNGNYTPNEPYHHVERDLRYLDLYSLTLARLLPRSVSVAADTAAEQLIGEQLGSRGEPRTSTAWDRFTLARREDPPPSDAWVQFVRLTFEPTDFKLVVLLATERAFARFLAEHQGLSEMLSHRLFSAEP